MKDFSPPSCKQHTLHQLTKRQQRTVHKLSSYIFAQLHKKNSRKKKNVYRHVSDYLNANQIIAVTVRIHSWNAVLETTKHKWDESFVRGSEVLSTFLKQPSQTASVKPTQWQGADGENRRRRRTLKREGHRTAFTSICDSTDKEIIQDQRIMKLAD